MIEAVKLFSSCALKANRALNSATQTKALIGSAANIKDEFILNLANNKVSRVLGEKPTVSYKEEEILKTRLSDIAKKAADEFKRVRYSFIPTVFPSGKKVNLRKSVLNEIIDNCTKGKGTKFSYTKKSGEEISGVVSKKLRLQNEDCYCAKIKRISKEGIEEVSVAHYPKSNEIRVVKTDENGQKKHCSIQGNDFSNRINPLSDAQNTNIDDVGIDKDVKVISIDDLE